MSRMRAVLVNENAPSRLALGERERPTPAPHEALIKVAAISLNRGEVRNAGNAALGSTIGWDLAGTVDQAAPSGLGPPAGARVVGLLSTGAWAEYAAVPVNALAVLPENVSFAQASTLPVAALTALRALEKGGLLIEKRVLFTGASGGVGLFAMQLGRMSGAHLVGTVRQERSKAVALEMGAHEVVAGDDISAAKEHGPYDLIVDTVGGDTFARALAMLAPDGMCVILGMSGGRESTIDIRQFYAGGGEQVYGFFLFHEHQRNPVSRDLSRLLRLVSDGRLKVHIELEAPWEDVGAVAQKLTDRQFTGKAVLHLG